MKNFFESQFFLFFCILFGLPTLFIDLNPEAFIIDISLAAVALLILTRINSKTLYFNKNIKDSSSRYFLWGDFFKSDAQKEKMEDIYKKLEFSKRIKRYIGALFVFGVGLILCLTVLDIRYIYIPIFCSLMVLSTFWRHLYFILLLKILILSVLLIWTGLMNRNLLLTELVLIYFTLVLFSKESMSSFWQRFDFKLFAKFFLICGLAVFIVPKSQQEKEVEKRGQTKIIKIKRTNLKMKFSTIESKLKSQSENIESEIDKMISQIDSMEKLLQNFPDIGIDIEDSLNKTKIELYGMKEELDDQALKGTLKSGSIKKLLARMKEIKGRSFLDSKKLQDLETPQISELESKTQGGTFFESFNGGADELVESLKGMEESALELERVEKELAKPIEPKSSKKRDILKEDKLLGALACVSIFFLVNFLVSLRKKKKNRILTQNQEDAIQTKFKQLRGLKLTPNEEIIKSYNLWRDEVKDGHFKDGEAPPPMKLSEFFFHKGGKHDSIKSISILFCDCYYGDLQASKQQLKSFRQNILKILSY